MVIHLIVGNIVDLRMLGHELLVERINGGMGLYAGRVTVTKGQIQRASLCVR